MMLDQAAATTYGGGVVGGVGDGLRMALSDRVRYVVEKKHARDLLGGRKSREGAEEKSLGEHGVDVCFDRLIRAIKALLEKRSVRQKSESGAVSQYNERATVGDDEARFARKVRKNFRRRVTVRRWNAWKRGGVVRRWLTRCSCRTGD